MPLSSVWGWERVREGGGGSEKEGERGEREREGERMIRQCPFSKIYVLPMPVHYVFAVCVHSICLWMCVCFIILCMFLFLYTEHKVLLQYPLYLCLCISLYRLCVEETAQKYIQCFWLVNCWCFLSPCYCYSISTSCCLPMQLLCFCYPHIQSPLLT